ncbi:MAG: hypothetical protein U1F98_04265 [Verrucomicrobiota bacterium]
MRTNRVRAGFCLFIAFLLAAAAPAGRAAESDTNAPPWHPIQLSIDAGTLGVGGSVAWRFLDHLGVRAGADYFSYHRTYTYQDIPYDATVRPLSEVLTLNWYPWKEHSFYVSAGALFNQNQLTGTASTTGSFVIDGSTYPGSDVGTLNLKIEQQPVNPYLSIGGNFFYFDHAHHWSLGGELGVAYTGKPRVSLTRSGGTPNAAIDASVAALEQQMSSDAENYQFWPVLKLAVGYSF